MTNTGFVLPAKGVNVEDTLFCGQSFSWQREGSGFAGVVGTRAVYVEQQNDDIYIAYPYKVGDVEKEQAFWQQYFALDLDYTSLLQKFSTQKKLAACVEAFPGVRVLRQPFFDTLLSFIISQNNHIPRITAITQRLREMYGPLLPGGAHGYPLPDDLAKLTPEDLAPLRAGFRAKYLIDAAQKVASGEVDETAMQQMTNDEARQMLMRIYGVGVKVADCVLLYAMARTDVVPMDVWMKRAMDEIFPRGMPRAAKGYEGIAQQFIFCWARENL